MSSFYVWVDELRSDGLDTKVGMRSNGNVSQLVWTIENAHPDIRIGDRYKVTLEEAS